MLKSRLCDYNDTIVKETIAIINTAAANADAYNANKKVILKFVLQLLIA